jgi:hypothetical protein
VGCNCKIALLFIFCWTKGGRSLGWPMPGYACASSRALSAPVRESPPPSPSPSNGFAPSPSLEQIEALRVHCCRHDRRLRSRGRLTSCSSAMLPDGRRSGASLSGARRLRPLSVALAGFAPSPSWIEAARHHQGGRRSLS